MANFLTLQILQCTEPKQPAKLPVIADNPQYAEWQEQLRKVFQGQVVQGQELFTAEFGLDPEKRMRIQVRTIQQTAALVQVGVVVGSKPPQLAGAWLLLAGFAESDNAAVEWAKSQEAGDLFPPEALDSALAAPKPMVVQLSMPVLLETGMMVLFLIACAAFGDAFFDQFGESGDEDVELPPPPDMSPRTIT